MRVLKWLVLAVDTAIAVVLLTLMSTTTILVGAVIGTILLVLALTERVLDVLAERDFWRSIATKADRLLSRWESAYPTFNWPRNPNA